MTMCPFGSPPCRHLLPLLPPEGAVHGAQLPSLRRQEQGRAVRRQVVLQPVPGHAETALCGLPAHPVSASCIHDEPIHGFTALCLAWLNLSQFKYRISRAVLGRNLVVVESWTCTAVSDSTALSIVLTSAEVVGVR